MTTWYNRTVAQVQSNACRVDCQTWSLANHLAWYHHCKSRGFEYFSKRFGVRVVTPSRNKREGKFLAGRARCVYIDVPGWGEASYTKMGRFTRNGPTTKDANE